MKSDVGDKEIEELLRPALKKVRQQQYINFLMRGLVCGLMGSSLLLILSRFYLWPGVFYHAFGVAGLVLLVALILALYFRPGIWQAALAVDAAGLKQRITTALEFSGESIDMAVRQRQDAIKHLRFFDCEANLPLQFSKHRGQLIGGLLVLVLFLTFWPNPHQAELANQIANKKEISRQEEKIAQLTRELQDKNKELPVTQREKLIEDLQLLEKNLHQSGNLPEALKSLSKAEEKLSKISETQASLSEQDLVSLLAALRTQADTRLLADKIASADKQASQAEIDKLMNTSAQPNGKEAAQSFSRTLEKAAASAASLRAAQALQAMAGSAKSTGAASSSARQDLNRQVAGFTAQAGVNSDINQAQSAIQEARGSILAGNGVGNSQLASSGSPSVSTGTGNNTGTAGEGASGSGGTGEQGAAGNSSGKGGSGAGKGSSNSDSSCSSKVSSPNTASGQNPYEMNLGEYEKIYAPARIGRAGESSYVKGEAGNGPRQIVDTDDPLTNSGSMRPYQEVIGHYSQSAQDSLERSSIPATMSELVKNYFSSLED